MHEMSIAQSIVDIAMDYAQKEKAQKVTELELSIGTLSGIEFEALDFAMEVCKKGTLLNDAQIVVDKIQAIAKCIDCENEFKIVHLFDACPHCQSYRTQLICGKEMQVKSLLIE